jgi:ribonuclease P protein component
MPSGQAYPPEQVERYTTLRWRRDFLYVAGRKRSNGSPGLLVQIAPRRPIDPNRLQVGFTASRRVGGAVIRNRCKRLLRALVTELMVHEANPDYLYVLIARQATATRPYDQLKADLRHCLRRLKVLRSDTALECQKVPA